MADEIAKIEAKERDIDPYLDYLYNSNVRCPYCHGRILKYTTTCPRCGVTKKQIGTASNKRAKEIMENKTGEMIFMSRRRPRDVKFTDMAIRLLGGLFGWHCFYSGRKVRGRLMLIMSIIGLLGVIIFMPDHPWRVAVQSIYLMQNIELRFPTDFLLMVTFIMWVWDICGVVFGYYKYPIRLGDAETTYKGKYNATKK